MLQVASGCCAHECEKVSWCVGNANLSCKRSAADDLVRRCMHLGQMIRIIAESNAGEKGDQRTKEALAFGTCLWQFRKLISQ